jgi:hypothetical protein
MNQAQEPNGRVYFVLINESPQRYFKVKLCTV